MCVVDPFEMIYVANRQPVLAILGTFAAPLTADKYIFFITCRLTQYFEQVLVESFAIGQTGERVSFSVVKEGNMVGEILDKPHQQDTLVRRDGFADDNIDQVNNSIH